MKLFFGYFGVDLLYPLRSNLYYFLPLHPQQTNPAGEWITYRRLFLGQSSPGNSLI